MYLAAAVDRLLYAAVCGWQCVCICYMYVWLREASAMREPSGRSGAESHFEIIPQ